MELDVDCGLKLALSLPSLTLLGLLLLILEKYLVWLFVLLLLLNSDFLLLVVLKSLYCTLLHFYGTCRLQVISFFG